MSACQKCGEEIEECSFCADSVICPYCKTENTVEWELLDAEEGNWTWWTTGVEEEK